jgi:7-keto-8-aminopelargonate synthetase-like enzyme
MTWPPVPEISWDGRPFLYFCGTGYLGLQTHGEVIEAGRRAMACGLHTATSRSGWGSTSDHEGIEKRLMDFTGYRECLYLPTGFLSVKTALDLLRPDVTDLCGVIMTANLHPAGREAVRSTGLPVREIDPDFSQLEGKLFRDRDDRPVIVVADGVFPISGAGPMWDRLEPILESGRPVILIVDDAHGFGVLGTHGLGSLNHCGWIPGGPFEPAQCRFSNLRVFHCGTLSKAIGGYGGFVLTNDQVNRRDSCVYTGTTPSPAPVAAATRMALKIFTASPEIHQSLQNNISYFKKRMTECGIATGALPVPIWSRSFDDTAKALQFWRAMAGKGILCQYFPSYSDASRPSIRMALFATHKRSHIDRLVAAIQCASAHTA